MDLKTFLDTNSWTKTNNSSFISVSNDGKEFNFRTLNLVQRILRFIGFYSDTHLKNVIKAFNINNKNRTWSIFNFSTSRASKKMYEYLCDKYLKRYGNDLIDNNPERAKKIFNKHFEALTDGLR